MASELKQLPGGNRLRFNVRTLNNPSHDALDFSYSGQTQLEVHADRVMIDYNGYFSYFNKYKSELQFLIAVLAFLG
ncbi:MAG: hypothetical protein ACREC3_11860, partial [Methyloceanibacter sp.]